ncbi:hypothetical protein RclHR1_10680001 [Rhizophagus clarus]|uniref:Protein kinase domain-containing protein n=1 Tax=Rhizophagus clarus TaxID=94130 RepID=A0A2Z6Q2H8_9GLOM|nr:hypothetical protein RclHR1_10680001 [Rhizophagus clarus]
METLDKTSKEKQKNSWKYFDSNKYQFHVTISSASSSIDPTITSEEEITSKGVVYMEDLEKRKNVYGICGECNEPGTGKKWCQPCNSKRFKENFQNWTSENKDIDELLQYSQLNAVYYTKLLEWIPYENFQCVTYIDEGGFSKIYSADWPDGHIEYWSIESQKWVRSSNKHVVLKSLNNSSDINIEFLNEIKSQLHIYFWNIISYYGITRDPNTKDYMMVLEYCTDGNLRNYYLSQQPEYNSKIYDLLAIAKGLMNIHNADKVHKNFHSGNILFKNFYPYISDVGMCQPADKEQSLEGVYGVLPYMAPEVLYSHQYTKESDIYSFGVIMNEFISEEIPYKDVPHDSILAEKICNGSRPKIFKGTPKLFEELIMKCWDAKAKNRPTIEELYQTLKKWDDEKLNNDSEIFSQVKEWKQIRENEYKNNSNKNKSKNLNVHSQAFYVSRPLNFQNLSEPINSTDFLSVQSDSASEYFDP